MRAQVLLLLLVGCSSPRSEIELAVTTADGVVVEGYHVRIADHEIDSDPVPQLELVLPDEMTGRSHLIEVWGKREGRDVAYGTVSVTPALDKVVHADVVLGALNCVSVCERGAVRCEGDSVVTCESSDGCMQWSSATACPTESPYCSNGSCAAQCADECSAGAKACDANGARTCGQYDSDSCLDWSAPIACPCAGNACASCNLGPWEFESPDGGGYFSQGTSLALGPNGPSVAFDWADAELGFREKLGQSWQDPILVDDYLLVGVPSHAVKGNKSYIASTYGNASRGLNFHERDGQWSHSTVVPYVENKRDGEFPSLGVDAAGGIHIAYYAYTMDDLKLAYRPPGGVFTTSMIDASVLGSDNTGVSASLFVDASGGDYVAYHTADKLWLATRAAGGTTWTKSVIDSTAGPGAGTSIARDPNGGIHVSYYANPGALKYAYRAPGGTTWSIMTADAASATGARSSLAVDIFGNVHIAYLRTFTSSAELKYATRPPGGTFTVVGTGLNARGPSLGVLPTGELRVSFADWNDRNFKLASRSCLP